MSANRRKVLVPLATLLAAGAVAIGSGATFTSSTVSTTAVTSGVVQHTNNVTSLDLDGLKPGDVATGSVTVENTGDLDATLTLTQTNPVSEPVFDDTLTVDIVWGTGDNQSWSGNFGTMSEELDLGALNVNDTTTVTWTVTFDQDAGNTYEGRTATASYQWVSTQLDGETNRTFLPEAIGDLIGD